ncbi:putative ABC transporter substrate-binding protein [Oscillibacter sp. CAG:155]|nr:putative ABC transporter substrate-binding protein [Oscillibacter sp. CAG:155]
MAAGDAACPAEGFIAPGVPENEDGDFRTVGGSVVETDPEKYQSSCLEAQKLLNAAAGGAPTGLEYLYVDEGTAGDVAQEVCGEWSRALGVDVTPKAVTAEELETALRTGEYDLAAGTFQPLGNDAECFLRPWVTDGEENVLGYANSAYDTLMSIIASASDSAARMGCLHDAEELLLGDYALAPLYTTVTADQLRENLTGVCRDARGWFSFASVAVRTA